MYVCTASYGLLNWYERDRNYSAKPTSTSTQNSTQTTSDCNFSTTKKISRAEPKNVEEVEDLSTEFMMHRCPQPFIGGSPTSSIDVAMTN